MSKTSNINTERKAFLARLTAGQLRNAARLGARIYAGVRTDEERMHLWISAGHPSDRAMHEASENFGGVNVYREYSPWENVSASDIKKLDAEALRKDIDEAIDSIDIELDERIERTA